MRDSCLQRLHASPSNWQYTGGQNDFVAVGEPSIHATRHQMTEMSTNNVQCTGIPSAFVKRIFKTACRLRYSQPTTEDIVGLTETSLDYDIVAAILEGALRLLPTDDSPDGRIARKNKMETKAAQALAAETAFAARLRTYGFQFSVEAEQRETIRLAIEAGSVDTVRLTPDILFSEPTRLCGIDCHWNEYKNMFGFKSDPFVHKKNKKQLQRYVAAFGKGIVVYRLGYECDHLMIDGLTVVREADMLQWIAFQEPLGE